MSDMNQPKNSLEAYERIVPLAYFNRVRDGLAHYLSEVRAVHPKVNPVMVALEYILQAEAIHDESVYEAVSNGNYETAIALARKFFIHVGSSMGGDRNMARLEFDAMRRWAVPASREGAEIFWLAEFSALYGAPFDHDYLEALQEVLGNGRQLKYNYDKTFARDTAAHAGIGRQFNQLCTHVKFFSA